MFCRVFDLVFFEYVQIRFPRKRRGRDGGNWLEPILFGIVNVLHRPRCPITYIFHVWNHACLLLQKGEGRHKGSNPDCSRTVYSPHEKKERRSSVGALGKECSSISTQAREGSCFPHTGVPFPLFRCCPSLLSCCETADPSVLNQPLRSTHLRSHP